jgi:heptaprenylglyceryl phosphate synthase
VGAHRNKLKVTLSEVNAPILFELGSLIPGAGTTIEKILRAAAKSNGIATTGIGSISNGALIFMADNLVSWVLGTRLILNIPLNQVTAMYTGATYLGGCFFTLEYGGTRTDMCAIYGGSSFRDNLGSQIQAAGGIIY